MRRGTLKQLPPHHPLIQIRREQEYESICNNKNGSVQR